MPKLILDLCAGSGSWSAPYRANPDYLVHLVDLPNDVRYFAKPLERVHGILCAPPCTHLAASGARWWQAKGQGALLEALGIADACLRLVALCNPTWWVLENPKGRLSRFYGKPQMSFNPCDFGDPWNKKTLLWGNFNPPVKTPVEPIKTCPQGSWLQALSGQGKLTKQLRSATPQGFAHAFYLANP